MPVVLALAIHGLPRALPVTIEEHIAVHLADRELFSTEPKVRSEGHSIMLSSTILIVFGFQHGFAKAVSNSSFCFGSFSFSCIGPWQRK
jgi:hypothetical protein